MKPRVYILVLVCFFWLGIRSQNANVDSLKQALKNAVHDTTRCQVLNQLVETTDEKEWPEFNRQMGDIARQNLSVKKDNKELTEFYSKYLSGYYTNLGFLAHEQGDLATAVTHYEKALLITKSINDLAAEATLINNIGYVFMDQGNISNALSHFERSLEIFEKLGDKKGIVGCLNNIGYIYDNQDDVEKAKDYYLRCLKIREEIGDPQGLSITLNNLGVLYKEAGDHKKGLDYLLKSLRIREQGVDKSAIASTQNNLGALYWKQGDAAKALEYHEKSLKLFEEIGDKNGISGTLVFMGDDYMALGQPGKAIAVGERAAVIAKEIGFPEKIKFAALMLNAAYAEKGDYANALRTYETYVLMRDSIKNEETQRASIRSQFRLEYDHKEQEAKAAQEKRDLQNEEEKQKQVIIRNVFIGGFALILMLVLVIFRSYLQNKKKNKLIELQKLLVEEKQKEIIDSIHYAQRIQKALIPGDNYFARSLLRLKK